MSEPEVPNPLERCIICDEQYCDTVDELGFPVHESCNG